MQVIFIKDVSGIARKNEVREVPDGYANNYLIPKGFAAPASSAKISQLKNQENQKDEKERKEQQRNTALKNELDKKTFSIEVKVGDKNQIYGSVHEKDVIERVREKMNIELEKNQIQLPKHMKELGEYEIEIKLGKGLVSHPKIKLITKG